eukprot:CAMPEP_0185442012 /NCGR_PEP_ID=MMETSP1365-20130426/43713_1 /TAXON_ID=38817 /ORGANISM="Gephyrocapsa oceanica, Strain RCC1303" /LENGTH=44 /DNA_ID= /DNA_START= /DNA_END= /DNA_ORIENTATION=
MSSCARGGREQGSMEEEVGWGKGVRCVGNVNGSYQVATDQLDRL